MQHGKPFHRRQGILVPDNCLSCALSKPVSWIKDGSSVYCTNRPLKPYADGKYPFGEYDRVSIRCCGSYEVIGGETLEEKAFFRAWMIAELQYEIRELQFEEERWRSGSQVRRLKRYIKVHTDKIGDILFGKDAGDVQELKEAITWCKTRIKRPMTEAKRCAHEYKQLDKNLHVMEARAC